jgi:putative oxidoreductase
MKKILFSSKAISMDAGLLILRLAVGGLMLTHGWPKLAGFTERMDRFADPLGIGSTSSLGLAVFAEVFCSVLLMLGLLTRLSLIPLIITMGVAVFVIHANDPFSKQELGLLYLLPYLTLFFTGPGKYSVDKMMGK